MKQLLFFTCILFFFSACTYQNVKGFQADDDRFDNKFISFLENNEQQIRSWYHYMISFDGEYYTKRVFYPEKKLLLTKERYLTKFLKRKNGQAEYWHETGHKRAEGSYRNGLELGEWKYYHRVSGALKEKGSFQNGDKNGRWQKFDSKGRLVEERDYQNDEENGSFIEYDTLGAVTNKGIYQNGAIISQSNPPDEIELVDGNEQMPYLSSCKAISDTKTRNECSNRTLLKHIYKNLKYPKQARLYGLEGTVVVQFVIQKDGTIEDVEVIRGLNDFLKSSVENVLLNMPSWEPGIQRGEPVAVFFTLPVKFKLEG